MKTIVYYETGGPDVFKLEERPTPEPGPGQVRVKLAATGSTLLRFTNAQACTICRCPTCRAARAPAPSKPSHPALPR